MKLSAPQLDLLWRLSRYSPIQLSGTRTAFSLEKKGLARHVGGGSTNRPMAIFIITETGRRVLRDIGNKSQSGAL